MTRYAKAPSARLLGFLRACALGLLTTIALLLAPTSASALVAHVSLGNFGSANQPSFTSPEGLAVDQASGDLLVIDAGAGTISRFKPDGTPNNFSALATNVINGSATPQGSLSFGSATEVQVAVDNSGGVSDGNIYVPQLGAKVVDVFASTGAYLGHLTEYSQGTDASGPATPLNEPCGVGVDPSGNVYVGDYSGFVHVYTPSANPPVNADNSANLEFAENCTLAVGAAATAGSVFPAQFGRKVAKLDIASGKEKYVVAPSPNTTVSVDPASGHVYTASGSEVKEYDASGATEATLLSSISFSKDVSGIAADKATGDVYVARQENPKIEVWGPAVLLPDVTTEAATAVTKDSATLHGTISAAGGPDASCEFQYISEAAFQTDLAKGKGHDGFEGATSVDCTPPGPFNGSGSEAVSAPLTNLSPGTDYRFRVLGANVNGSNPGQALGFLTLGPTIVSSTPMNITTTAATLTGFVNPRGKPFTYHFDYGPTASYGSSVPVPDASGGLPIGMGNLESGSKTVEGVVMSQGAFAVGQDIVGAGIKPGTTITAIEGSTLTLSASPTEVGPVSLTSTTVFVSQPITGLTPGTEYHARLVAANADGTSLGPDRGFSTYPVDTGLPDGRAYEMVSPVTKIGEVFAPEPLGLLGGSCVLCLPGINNTLMPMQARADGEAFAYEGQPFSAGLSSAGNQYLGRRSDEGWTYGAITPPSAPGISDQSGFKAFSPDLSRGVLLQTTPKLSPQAPGEGQESFSNLYRWEAGNPNLQPLITVEPPNREPSSSGANAFEVSFAGGNSGTATTSAFEHLVFEANDALTVEVPTIAPPAPAVGEGPCGGLPISDCDLYEWSGGQLRLVNVLPGNTEAASGATIGSGRRLAESLASRAEPATQAPNVDHAIAADGSRIFWSDGSGQVYVRINGTETVKIEDPGQFLTATPDGSKVLLSDGCIYSLESEECEGEEPLGSPAGFLGILGASEDLSRIYFVSTEALAAGAEAGTCETANNQEEEEGKVPAGFGCNAYAYEEGEVSLIAALNERDNNSGLGIYGSWKASKSNRTAQVSPDGRYLALMSYGQLTSYDNRRSGGGACGGSFSLPPCFEVYEYDLEAGSLRCASCNPNGQRPLGRSSLSLIAVAPGGSFPQPENLPGEGEGRLFFESQDTLSSKDTNGAVKDVYEWTPNGVGGCVRAGGCVALVSSGHDPNDSMFLNSTPSGNDAFFITREQLLARDKDDQLDVYDARVDGGIAEEITPPCLGKACRGPGSNAPAAQSPGTSTFSGPPNKKPHKHKKHKKQSKHKSKKHKSQKSHKRSAQDKKTGGSK